MGLTYVENAKRFLVINNFSRFPYNFNLEKNIFGFNIDGDGKICRTVRPYEFCRKLITIEASTDVLTKFNNSPIFIRKFSFIS